MTYFVPELSPATAFEAEPVKLRISPIHILNLHAQRLAKLDILMPRCMLTQPEKNSPSAEIILPDTDPGFRVAHRWRKRLCRKTDGGTVIDLGKMDLAKQDAAHHAPAARKKAVRQLHKQGLSQRQVAAARWGWVRHCPS